MAMYRSRFTNTKCKSDAPAKTDRVLLHICITVQCTLESSSCRTAVISAIKRGCPISPIIPSVVAKQARAMLDLVRSRGLIFTETITSTFKTTVKGQVIMFIISMNTKTT